MQSSFEAWQKKNLHANAILFQRLRELEQKSAIEINYSNGKTTMSPGRSSVLTKLAIEVFANNFLNKPSVILISESAEKVNWQYSKNLDIVKLALNPKKVLPDIILADSRDNDLIFVFIEIVNTDGPITTSRKEALIKLAAMNNFDPEKCLFVTVFASRSDPAYRRVQANLAWGTYVWFADEPDRIIHLIDQIKDKQILTY
ncbi:hypothetical protein D3C71_1062910 [compost metagenome]